MILVCLTLIFTVSTVRAKMKACKGSFTQDYFAVLHVPNYTTLDHFTFINVED